MVRRMLGTVAVVMVALMLGLPGSAAADEPSPDKERLDRLQAIVGQSVPYRAAGGAGQPMALDPYECTLYPSRVHPRTSSGKKSVGAKPYTECKLGPPTIISQSSTLYIVEWGGLYYKAMDSKTATSRNEKKLTQRNVEYFCANVNKSRFQQETKGYTVQGGRTYQSAVITPSADFECGY